MYDSCELQKYFGRACRYDESLGIVGYQDFISHCPIVLTVTLNVYFISICLICYVLNLSDFRSAVVIVF